MQFSKNALLVISLLTSSQVSAAVLTPLNNSSLADHPELNQILNSLPSQNLMAKNGRSTAAYGLSEIKQASSKIKTVKHTRYQQMYSGLPVFGYHVIAHEKAGAPPVFSGVMVSEVEKDLSAKQDAPLNAAPAYQQKKTEYLAAHPQAKITEFANSKQTVIFIDKNNQAREAYHISFLATDSANDIIERPNWIIDAATGEQLKAWNGLTTMMPKVAFTTRGTAFGGNEKTGIYRYGTEPLPYLTFAYDVGPSPETSCHLYNQKVKIMDFQNGWGWYVGPNPRNPTWTCRLGDFDYPGDPQNGAASPSSDALAFGTFVMNEYAELGLSPIPSPTLVMNVHVGAKMNNAFWDGFGVSFGDGSASSKSAHEGTYPFVTIDIVGHEISHAFTEHTSGLVYEGQSGGLNESFSDIMGKYMEVKFNAYHFPEKPLSWSIGGDVFRDAKGVIRYMDNPPLKTNSIMHAQDYYEGINVHWSSGVFNHVFYLMATDPRMPSALGQPYDGIRDAAEIFIYANMNYWYPMADFGHAAAGLMQAAEVFESAYNYDDPAPYVNIVNDALLKVGIYCYKTTCSTEKPDEMQL